MGRVLGIDYGDKWVGLALSDPSLRLSLPFDVIEEGPDLGLRLREIAHAADVDRIVLGLPRNMDGSLGPKARQVMALKETLEKECGLPIELWDERLTTVQAEQILRDGGASRKQRARNVDKIAAQILLQSFLDSRVGS